MLDGIDYTLFSNPCFDTALAERIPEALDWIGQLEAEIDAAIAEQLDGWCEWNGEKDLVGIDVSDLATKQTVDVAYTHSNWGDLEINIVIAEGRIRETYAGD